MHGSSLELMLLQVNKNYSCALFDFLEIKPNILGVKFQVLNIFTLGVEGMREGDKIEYTYI